MNFDNIYLHVFRDSLVALNVLGILFVIFLIFFIGIDFERDNSRKSPYYNPDKVGNCKRDKKNKPIVEKQYFPGRKVNMKYNPKTKIAESAGIDIPTLHVYLAGRIAGDCIEKCLAWRHQIVDHYRDYKGRGAYPIVFLDALNSKESDSIDTKGLTSAIPPNLIYDKDLLSVETADVVVVNMDDFLEAGIEHLLIPNDPKAFDEAHSEPKDYRDAYNILKDKILNRRENLGTICEMSWALYLKKPLILIVPERRRETFEKHPFTKRASVIVASVDELLEKKWLQILYKSIAGATY